MSSKCFCSVVAFLGCLLGSVKSAELQHFWDFEGDEWWLDKAGEAHGDVPLETTTLEIESGAGDVGSALKVQATVEGGDDHLVVDSGELYAPGEEAFSFSFWIRLPDDGTTDPRGIFDFSGNGQDGVQSLYIGTSGELAFRIDFPGAGNALVKVPIGLEDGEWHSVAATYDPAVGLEVHVDGFGIDGSAPAVPGSVTMASEAYLGSFNFTGNSAIKGIGGKIDDLAVYSGVLSEEEIMAQAVRTKAPIYIETVSFEDGALTITWNGQDGEIFAVWRSGDLQGWAEINDSIPAGPDGGTFTLQLDEPYPDSIYLQVRRPEE